MEPTSIPAESASSADGEKHLVERARTDPEAFAELYRRHYAGIGRYLQARTGDRHATEDLLSETFLAALRGLDRYRNRGVPFRYWLLRIATNAVRGQRRREGRIVRVASGEEPCVPARDERAEPDVDQERTRVRAALRALDPKHEEVLVLHYLEDLGIEPIAKVLGCRPGTVKSRLARAREALRRIARMEH